MSSSAAQERIRTPHIEQKWRMVGIVGCDQPWIRKEERSLSFSICGVEWNDSLSPRLSTPYSLTTTTVQSNHHQNAIRNNRRSWVSSKLK